jgi:PhzF family phenazine biosynthesis protein
MKLSYSHVDVFSDVPFGGNSLPVFCDVPDLSADQLLRITQEMRHFEAIFLQPLGRPGAVRARIFDLFEELPFAGHPIIGAAAVLHERSAAAGPQTWQFQLPSKTVEVTTQDAAAHYSGWLDQGVPQFLGSMDRRGQVACAFNLAVEDLAADLPIEVVSTGLRYLIVPVIAGALGRARITSDITAMVAEANAQFAVLFDESAVEMRHWNNDGIIEDVATGSAAGTIGAYRLRHGLVRGGDTFILNQGQFTGRPSKLRVMPQGCAEVIETVKVGGDVSFVGHGMIEARP